MAGVSNNYWCTTDSATIASHIYDGYDNINLGLVSFMPLDTQQCYLSTGIAVNEKQNFSFTIFPNPTNGTFTIETNNFSKNFEISVYNLTGQVIYAEQFSGFSGKKKIDLSQRTKGIYLLRLKSDTEIITKKIVVY